MNTIHDRCSAGVSGKELIFLTCFLLIQLLHARGRYSSAKLPAALRPHNDAMHAGAYALMQICVILCWVLIHTDV